jgi:hypothetical protein
MIKNFFLTVILLILISCNRYPDPSSKIIDQYTFSFDNKSGQKYFAGEAFKDTVKFRVTHTGSDGRDSVLVVFKVISGGGELTYDSGYTNSKGIIATNWKLGNQSFLQTLRASAYDNRGQFLFSSDLSAYGFRNDAWDTLSISPDGGMTGMVADTVHGYTLMITNSHLYKQGERYYIWNEIIHPNLVSPRTIEIDGNGVVYVSTWNGEIVYSKDQGVSWNYCTKPYPGIQTFIYMYVSNDNSIWVAKSSQPTMFSKDGGKTWKTTGSELNSTYIGDVFRLKNGSLLFCTSACCFILYSDDDGASWTKISTPASSNKLYVNDKDELFVCGQQSGVYIYKSTDMGITFNPLYGVGVTFRTNMDNVFNKYKGSYYVMIPGYGILRTPDLINFQGYYQNSDIDNLFIDHNGVLIAKKWNSNTVYYRKNTK